MNVTLTNNTAPGQAYQAGDSFTLSITGAPANTPVFGSAIQNGGASSTTPFGSTDANGNFSVSNTWGTGDIGSWQELWTVGSQSAGLNFTIQNPTGSGGNNPGVSATTSPMTTSAQCGSMPVVTTGCPDGNWQPATCGAVLGPDGKTLGTCGSSIGPTGGLDLSWLTGDVNLFGMEIPIWGLLAAGGALLLLMPRGR